MARVLEAKTTAEVIKFFNESWFSVFGAPVKVTTDMGPEYISEAFQNLMERRNVVLEHVAVEQPWANGLAERAGGKLKAMLRTVIHAESVIGHGEMAEALGAVLEASNSDPASSGFSPAQAMLGKQPRGLGMDGGPAVGDWLDYDSSFAKRVAMREVARVAQVRLHYSQSLRRAACARPRPGGSGKQYQAQDLVYFWRHQKIKGKLLQLKRWHGPAQVVAVHGDSSAYVMYRGNLTKVPLEHLRHASHTEKLASRDYEAVLEELAHAVGVEPPRDNEIEKDLAQEFPMDAQEEEEQQYSPTTPGEEVPGGEDLQVEPSVMAAPATTVIFPYPHPSGLPPAPSLVSRRESVSTMPVSRRSSHQLDAAAHSAPGFQPADTTGGAPQAEVPHQEGVAASSTPVPTSQIETVPGGQAMPSSASDAVGAGLPELPAMPASHDERPERLERAAGEVLCQKGQSPVQREEQLKR